jgi:hypothetical protein
MHGTLINVATIVVGSILGIVISARLSSQLRETVVNGLGLFTLAFGLMSFLETSNPLVPFGWVVDRRVNGGMVESRRTPDPYWREIKTSGYTRRLTPGDAIQICRGLCHGFACICHRPDGDFGCHTRWCDREL